MMPRLTRTFSERRLRDDKKRNRHDGGYRNDWFWHCFSNCRHITDLQSCIGEHYQPEPSETLQKGFAQLLVMSKVGSGCFGEFVHKNAEAIIALFTIILGIATWLLWRAMVANAIR